MTTQSPNMKLLKVAATKATARAAAAKTKVREAKATLKQARKLFKMEKRAAKEARQKVDAALASVLWRPYEPSRTSHSAFSAVSIATLAP